MSMYIGEALVGEGNEIAHIDLLIGDKDGPVGHAFASANRVISAANAENGRFTVVFSAVTRSEFSHSGARARPVVMQAIGVCCLHALGKSRKPLPRRKLGEQTHRPSEYRRN